MGNFTQDQIVKCCKCVCACVFLLIITLVDLTGPEADKAYVHRMDQFHHSIKLAFL